ncbi:MAG: ABC transporter ATP-binding protein [Eubacteriales bacterium]|nr:ABC transporter ATP-binding protein [Eubacteriales bacterium]
MLEVKNIVKTFNAGTPNEKRALQGINLTLNDGDFVTIIGSNGAGKSTFLNALAGVWPIDDGQIIIGGKDITRMPEYRRAAFLGRVFQDPMNGTAAAMNIEENLALAMRRGKRRTLMPMINSSERTLYRERLSRLGLGLQDRMTSKVGLLSGGQRQALTLLMSTLHKPELLLLDEHTAALDPKTARKVLELTNEIVSEQNLTALMVTHNMRDAIQTGNRLIMMHEGRIIFDVSGEEKKKLAVEDLMHKFEEAAGEAFANDRMMLGN